MIQWFSILVKDEEKDKECGENIREWEISSRFDFSNLEDINQKSDDT